MQVRYNFLSSHLRLEGVWCQNFKQLTALAVPNLSRTSSNNETELSLCRFPTCQLQERRQAELMGRGSNSVRALLEAPKPSITLTTRTRSLCPCLLASGVQDDRQACVHLPLVSLRRAERSAIPPWVSSSAARASVPPSLKKTDARLLICFYERERTAWQIFWSVSQLQPKPGTTHTSDDPRLELITKAELKLCTLQNVQEKSLTCS